MSESDDKKLLAKLGEGIGNLRKQKNMTQTDLAKAIGRSVSLVSKIETGAHPLDYITLKRIALVLQTNITVIGKAEELMLPEVDNA